MKDLIPNMDRQYNLGADGRAWKTLVVDRIICNNISGAGVTISGAAQVDHGTSYDPATHKPQIEDPITGPQTFEGAITAQSTLGVTGLITASGGISGTTAAFSSTLAVTGETTLSNILRMNENIDMAGNFINGSGADNGLSFAGGPNATFSGTLTVIGQINASNAGNYSLDATGNVRVQGDFNALGQVYSSTAVYSTHYVQAASYCRGQYLRVTDGMSAPSHVAGQVMIYVDSSDGYLYAKDGAGNVGLLTDFT